MRVGRHFLTVHARLLAHGRAREQIEVDGLVFRPERLARREHHHPTPRVDRGRHARRPPALARSAGASERARGPVEYIDVRQQILIELRSRAARRAQQVRRPRLEHDEERVTVRYDDFDNPVEQVRLDVRRDMRMDDGAVKVEEKPSHVQRVRFEYEYDAYGNWTERVVWQRTEPSQDERRSNIERRTITYYGQ